MFCVTWLSLDERTNESVRNLQFQVAQLVFIPGDDLNKHLKTVPRSLYLHLKRLIAAEMKVNA